MANDEQEQLEEVSKDEQDGWKLAYTHGDFQRMAKRFNSDASKYRRAYKTRFATATTRLEMHKFFQSKKVKI